MRFFAFLPAKRISSYAIPAMTGSSRIRDAISQYHSGRPRNAKTKIAITITQSRNAVPHRGWIRLCRWTTSGSSSSPASYALIALCSAPWYWKTRRRSGSSEITERYAMKISTRTTPSTTTKAPSLSIGSQFVISAGVTLNSASAKPIAITKAKIIEAKKLFRANEADEENGEELFFAFNSVAMEDIMGDTTLTSADHLAVQMLQEGKVNGRKWMGFEWVPYQMAVESSTYYLPAWAKTGVVLGVGAEITTRLTERADKSYALQPYACMSIGAVRMEEAKVVEVAIQ